MHLAHRAEKWTQFFAGAALRAALNDAPVQRWNIGSIPKAGPHSTSDAPARELHVTAFVEHDLNCSEGATPAYGTSPRLCSRTDIQGCLGNEFVQQRSCRTAKLAPVDPNLSTRSASRAHEPVLSFLLDQA
jgi:hypothetical protein